MFFDFSAKRKTNETRYPPGNSMTLGMPSAGMKVDGETAYTYSAFWACVKIVSETIAYLPWHIMENGSKHAIARENPLDRIVYRRPNPEMNSFTYKEMMISHALTWGNHYAEIERNRMGEVVALWPIDPDRVDPQRDERGNIFYDIANDNGSNTQLKPADMFHLRGPSRDGLHGYSMIQMARESISLGLATEAFGSSFFGNGAIPGTVIQNDGGARLNAEGVKNLLKTWNKNHKGPRNFNKTEYLDAGMTAHVLGVPPSDAQFLETRKFQITEIARWFRIPPHKLADLERSTHTNIESQNIEFVTDSIMPWVSRIECQGDISLLKESDYGRFYNKINMKGLLRGDSKARSEYYKTMAALGTLSINEVRDMEDQDPLSGPAGDLRLVPLNMTTPERMASGEAKTAPAPSNSATGLLADTAQRFCKMELKRVEKAHEKSEYKEYLTEFYIGHARALVDGFTRPAAIVCEQIGADVAHLDDKLTQFFGGYVTKSADQLQHAIESQSTNALFCSWNARKADNLARDLTEYLLKGARNDV